jgi:hypothetical protein
LAAATQDLLVFMKTAPSGFTDQLLGKRNKSPHALQAGLFKICKNEMCETPPLQAHEMPVFLAVVLSDLPQQRCMEQRKFPHPMAAWHHLSATSHGGSARGHHSRQPSAHQQKSNQTWQILDQTNSLLQGILLNGL